jgi:ankyrin repeat protein
MIPLHHHLASRLPKRKILDYLVERCPESAQVRDKKGRLPLHYIEEQAYYDDFQALVEVWPEALKVQDSDGYLPLHRVVTTSQSESTEEIIENLLQQFPSQFKSKQRTGQYSCFWRFRPGPPVVNVARKNRYWRRPSSSSRLGQSRLRKFPRTGCLLCNSRPRMTRHWTFFSTLPPSTPYLSAAAGNPSVPAASVAS